MTTRIHLSWIVYALLSVTFILTCFDLVRADEPTLTKEEPEATADSETSDIDQNKTLDAFINEEDSTDNDKGFGDLGVMAVVRMLFWVLLVVVALYGGARLLKRYVPAARNMFGSGTLKVVGRTFLSPKQSILLVRVGRRMVVVGVTATGMSALAEIRDPEELEYIANELNQTGKPEQAGDFKRSLKEATSQFASDEQRLDASASIDTEQQQHDSLVNGIRSELDSISRKVNLWRSGND